MRAELLELFDYDLWANRQWLDYLPKMPDVAEAEAVLRHILGCQIGWLSEFSPHKDIPDKGVVPSTDLDRFQNLWTDWIRSHDPHDLVTIGSNTNRPLQLPLWHVAHHVLNHGTYHRGQLRTLAVLGKKRRFPETDSIGFFARQARSQSSTP